MSDSHSHYDAKSLQLRRSMEQYDLEFDARLKQASKPLTGVILAAVATAAAILGGAVALAIILPKFFPNLQ
jgi:hypothetical protein